MPDMKPDIRIDLSLPEGWAPDGASVFVLARLNDDGIWESIAPEFNIAGRGASANDALVNAMELLDDYLVLCAREGKPFEETRRSVSPGFRLAILSELVALVAGRKLRLRPRRPRRDCEYRIPLRLVGT
jgi:hypothetical protein